MKLQSDANRAMSLTAYAALTLLASGVVTALILYALA